MKDLRRCIMSAIVGVTALQAGSGSAFAQERAPEGEVSGGAATAAPETPDDIVVTARRRAERLQEVPVAVTALSAASLEARGASDVAAIAPATPGLSFNGGAVGGSGTSSSAQVFVRGIGQDDYLPTTDPGVGIYIDEIYLGRTTGSILALTDIERVEVLRGPQGTLFGRNTIGGAILVTTRKPDLSGTHLSVSANLGERSLIDLKGSVNLPLSDTVAVKISAGLKKQDGYGRSTITPGRYGDTDRWGITGQLLFQPSDRLKFLLSADYSEIDQPSPTQVASRIGAPAGLIAAYNGFAPARGLPLFNQALAATGRFTNSSQRLGYDRAKVKGASLTGEYEIMEDWSLKSITAYRESDVDFSADADTTSAPIFDVTTVVDQSQFSQEFQLSGTLGSLALTAGTYYYDEDIDYTLTADILPGLYGFLVGRGVCPSAATPCFAATRGFRQPSTLSIKAYAGFGQGTFTFTDWLSATGGLRYSVEKRSFDTQSFGTATGALQFGGNQSRRYSQWTPKIGIEVKPARDVLVYGSYSKGYKSGTFNGRATSGPALNEVLPENSDSYEIGLKSQFLDRKVTLNLSFYDVTYKNLQTTVTVRDASGAPATALINAAKAHAKGFEAELTVRPLDGLMLNATWGYIDGKITETTPVAAAQGLLVGNKLTKTPKNKVSLAAQYDWDMLGSKAFARVDYSWQSSMFHTPLNQFATFEPAYDVVNGRIGYTLPKADIRVALFVNNLFDERYAVNRSYVAFADYNTANFARPREFGISLAADF
ncbi:TonB-dependent receptor [Rhizorhabdus dicambivorans]|uniref:TonB-dependent receptor n=1 Tax=Rhizorhabdus dicambivorans TaxID=1850238 RepID=A0A2A4FYH5_9SPHN|nr:TonB-dependent receptor [Rhizorhabdus dicambivorans]ATE63631.1 TonB-dependent receptor [Rhizorhabdus dicambivorans]PCE42757.1 TonB-dependent receptor [Rhizorhabdus dicambivorans]